MGNITFTKDGQSVLANCINNRMKLVDKSTGQVLSEFKQHKNSKYRVEGTLIDSDRLVVSGSEDGAVYIYDLLEVSVR